MSNSLHKADWGNVAVLVVDVQNDFCSLDGAFALQGLDVTMNEAVAKRIQQFLLQARAHCTHILFSKQIESPVVTPANLQRQFANGKLSPVCAPNSIGSEFFMVTPEPTDIVLEKYTYDVFSNPELDRYLVANQIKTLLIAGVNTDVCIDATIRSVFTKGLQIVVLKDLVSTINTEVHEHFLKIFDRFYGDVLDSSLVFN